MCLEILPSVTSSKSEIDVVQATTDLIVIKYPNTASDVREQRYMRIACHWIYFIVLSVCAKENPVADISSLNIIKMLYYCFSMQEAIYGRSNRFGHG